MRIIKQSIIFILVFFLVVAPVSNAASVSEEPEAEVESEQDSSDADEGPTTEEKLDELEDEGQKLQKKTDRLNEELSALTGSLAELESETETLDSEIRLSKERLSDIGQKKQNLLLSVKNDVRFFYRNRDALNIGYAIFHFKSWSFLINYPYYVNRIIRSSRERISEYETILKEYGKLQSELEGQQRLLDEKTAELTARSEDVQKNIAKLIAASEANDEEIEELKEKLIEEEKERMRREAEERAAAELSALSEMAPSGYTWNGSYYQVEAFECSEEDVLLLASLIQAEAGGYDYAGMVAVGSVVLNRVFDNRFPKTIPDVIYSPGQFYPQGSGRLAVILAQGPWDSCIQAARDVIAGRRNVPNFYYKSDWYAEEHGIQGVNIGGNVFH